MGSSGVVTVLLSVRDGHLRQQPRVVSVGVFSEEHRDRVERKIADEVRNRLKGQRFTSPNGAEDAAIEVARRFLVHNHRKRPLIVADADGGP